MLRVCSSSQPPASQLGRSGREHPEDGVFMNSSAYANKCRECAKTIDAGSAIWFDKGGEPGRKTTCVQCHDVKVPAVSPEDEDPSVTTQKKTTKKRKAVAKLTPELLCDPHKGITAMFKAFPAVRFKGKGHEAADLRRLIGKYRECATPFSVLHRLSVHATTPCRNLACIYGCSLHLLGSQPPHIRLQPPSHTVTASITYGYSLHHIQLQPPSHTVTASITCGYSLITYGYSLHHMR